MNTIFSPLIEQAIELAAQWHDQTYRKSRWRNPAFDLPDHEVLRVPVIAHVTAVAVSVQRAGWEDKTVAAAFLHDVIEDGNRHKLSFRYEQLREQLGQEVADIVMVVSEVKRDADGNFRSWRDRKEGYLHQIRSGPAGAAAISLADKKHNMWTMNQSLEVGLDIFSHGPHRKGLSAGPNEQNWLVEEVLAASHDHQDDRLISLRAELEQELRRFKKIVSMNA